MHNNIENRSTSPDSLRFPTVQSILGGQPITGVLLAQLSIHTLLDVFIDDIPPAWLIGWQVCTVLTCLCLWLLSLRFVSPTGSSNTLAQSLRMGLFQIAIWMICCVDAGIRCGTDLLEHDQVFLAFVIATLGWWARSLELFLGSLLLAVGLLLSLDLASGWFDLYRQPLWVVAGGALFASVSYLQQQGVQRRIERYEESEASRQQLLQQAVVDIRLSEERFRRLSESLPIGVCEVTLDSGCLYTNSHYRSIVGQSLEETLSTPWYLALQESDRDAAAKTWRDAMNDGESFMGVFRSQTPSHPAGWLDVRFLPVYSDSGAAYVGVVEEISARKRAEEELHAHAEDLRRSRELEASNALRLSQLVVELDEARRKAEAGARAKSEFLANMSHEIRTPMTAILGYTELLCEQTPPESEAFEQLQTVRQNADFLLEIINDILDLSKIEAEKLEIELIRCSPVKVMQEVVGLMQLRTRSKNLSLTLETSGRLPETAITDPTRLRQIALNLVSNAIKFTHAGGVKMELVVIERPLADGAIETWLRLSVVDSGIGMSAETVSRLFQPFSQADSSTTRKYGGTGLGLTISKRLSELLGGVIQVSSVPGVGSTFTLEVPVTAPVYAAEQVPTPAAAPVASPVAQGLSQPIDMVTSSQASTSLPVPPTASISATPATPQPMSPGPTTPAAVQRLSGCRILLAEDGVDNQRLVSLILRKQGAVVTIVGNGQLACEAASQAELGSTPFDLVLMDMQMPVLDGYGATRQLREHGFQRPIIALTANAMSGDRERCVAAGCTDYAVKPIRREELMATLCSYYPRSAMTASATGDFHVLTSPARQ